MNTQKLGILNQKIKEINFSEIEKFKNQCKKERVPLADTKNTIYFGYFDKDTLKGFSAVFFVTAKEARIKSTYVLPQYRLNGISKELNDYCFDYILSVKCYNTITAFCTPINLKWYLNKGFLPVKSSNNITKVLYEKL